MKAIDAEPLFPWVRLMSKMMGRQGTIKRLTGTTSQIIKRVWQEENGRSSPSGLTPSDTEWFLRTPTLRYQSALILILHQQISKSYPPEISFATAYYHFSRITGGESSGELADPAFRTQESDYTISFARANYLVNFFTDDVDSRGQRLCALKIKQCRACAGRYLARQEEQPKCPLCD